MLPNHQASSLFSLYRLSPLLHQFLSLEWEWKEFPPKPLIDCFLWRRNLKQAKRANNACRVQFEKWHHL